MQITLFSGDKDQYRALLSAAFAMAAHFDGSEVSLQSVVEAFDDADRFVMDMVGGDINDRELAEATFAGAAGFPVQTIGDMFLASTGRFYSSLAGPDDIFEKLRAGGAAIIETDTVFVPTHPVAIPKSGNADPTFEIRLQPRLAWLLEDLKAIGIYTDDLIVHRGAVGDNMVRSVPYIVIDIPRLNKQIAVCDQVGEITFVSSEILDPRIYENCTKDVLKGIPQITAVECFNRDYWRNNIQAVLQGEQNSAPRPKMDVKRLAAHPTQKPFPLTVDMIAESARLYLARHGARPTQKSGIVEDGPCAGTTWKAIDAALRNGCRGLEGCGYKSLSALLDGEGIGVVDKTLSVDMIAESARLHLAQHGARPSAASGAVEDGPCAGTTWRAIDMALQKECRGLKDCGYKGLAALLDGEGVGVVDNTLSMEMIVESARLHLARYGKRPVVRSSAVEDGPCAGTTWRAIDMALRAEIRGLEGCGYKSLSALLDGEGIGVVDKTLSVDMIAESARLHLARYGKRPVVRSSAVEDGPCAGTTWRAIDAALRNGFRGTEGCGYKGLAALLDGEGFLKPPRGRCAARLKPGSPEHVPQP